MEGPNCEVGEEVEAELRVPNVVEHRWRKARVVRECQIWLAGMVAN